MLHDIDPFDSGDECVPRNLQTELDDSNHSDSSDSSDDVSDLHVPQSERQEIAGPNPDQSSQNDSTEWKSLRIGSTNTTSRVNAHNIFKEASGVSKSAKSKINTELDAWRLFIDERILKHVFRCTQQHGAERSELKDFSLEELENFIGLQYCRGFYGKNNAVELLRSENFGVKIFGETMSRNRFNEIKRHLRFDEKQTRSMRLKEDAFTHIRFVFDSVTDNCKRMYIPDFSLCIDEQLMPLKTRCKFIVFMPQKPDKFGMKFWMLTDNRSKYVCNLLPYLGSVEREERGDKSLANHVVHKLAHHLFNKGYNITTDNFFTNVQLARELKDKKTSLVGTVRSNSKGLPKQLTDIILRQNQSAFVCDKANTLLVKYQCKRNRGVYLLSTMHTNPAVAEDEKAKPLVIQFYNKEKCGTDIVDSMLRMMSSRCATRRWPVAVWQNLLDIVALNAWIVFQQATKQNVSRKDFLMTLVDCLTRKRKRDRFILQSIQEPSPKRRKCHVVCCKNRASATCRSCLQPLCGSHCVDSVQKMTLSSCHICNAAAC